MISLSDNLIEHLRVLVMVLIPVIGIRRLTHMFFSAISDVPLSDLKDEVSADPDNLRPKPKKVKVRKKTYDSPDCLANEPRGFFDKE